MPTVNSSTISSDSNHRALLKNIDVDSARRHSPNPSESGDGTFRTMGRDSPGGSPNPAAGAAALFTASTPNLPASPHSARAAGHRSRNSTDSVSSNAAIYGSGLPPEASQMLRQGMNIGEMINATTRGDSGRRLGQERASPLESGDRSAGTDPPTSAKDSKNFLSFLSRKKRQKEDSTFPSPEDLESPTSPAISFKPSSSLGSSRPGNASETSLLDHQRPSSSSYNSNNPSLLRGKRASSRLYILATANHWDFRMVDVTDVDSAADLRQLICINLGIPDSGGALVYLTELGQFAHDMPLDDMNLLANKRIKADGAGNLKVFVQPGGLSAAGLNMASQGFLSPSYLPPGATVDEDTYARLNGQRPRSSSSPPTSRQNSTVLASLDGKEEEKARQRSPEANGYGKTEADRRSGGSYQSKRRQVAPYSFVLLLAA